MQQIPWGIEKRLEFIEQCLFWSGRINRSDIIRQFGVSVPQASNDLTRYQAAATRNVTYDRSKKRYVTTEDFVPLFYKPAVDHYRAQSETTSDECSKPNGFWLGASPVVASMPALHQRIDTDILRSVVRAIREERAIEICYQTLRTNCLEPVSCRISPHALGNDGLYWYTRAFCHIEKKFKDFRLSRILKVCDFRETTAKSETDRLWQESIDVILIPNPELTASQRATIALDYGMRNGKICVPVRKAFLYYFKKWLRLDVAQALNRPQESPVVVENKDAFEQALNENSS